MQTHYFCHIYILEGKILFISIGVEVLISKVSDFLISLRPFLRKNRFISVVFPKNTKKNKVTKRKRKCFPFFLDVSDEKKINTDMFQYALKD